MIKTLTISILFFMISSFSFSQDQITVNVVYEGVDEEVYYFSSEEDFTTYAFQKIDEAASKKYMLSDRKLIGKTFAVIYTSEQFLDDENEPYEVFTIKDITLIEKKK